MGHGAGSFSWTVAEICAREGFWPDIISSDLHVESVESPAYDLLTVMTKMLHVGMPLNDVIKAVTVTPAIAFRRGNAIGSLNVNHAADITVLHFEEFDMDLEDCNAQLNGVLSLSLYGSTELALRPLKLGRFPVRVNYRSWPH